MTSIVDRIEITTVPDHVIVGLRERVAAAGLGAFFGRAFPAVAAELARLGVAPAGPPTAVYTHERSRVFDLTVGYPVNSDLPAPAGLVAEHLPAGRAVRAEHTGPYETLPATYAALGTWFADHARTPPRVMWEEYLVGPGDADEAHYRTRIVYPLD